MQRSGLSPKVESWIAFALLALAVLTVAWPDWLEGIFGIDPDHGDGNAEIAIVIVLALVGAGMWLHARLRAKRLADPAATSV